MTHHPHLHMIVPGGGISFDGKRWVPCRPGFLLPVRVLSRLFRRLFLAGLAEAHAAGRLAFFGELDGLRRREAFAAHLAPLKRKNWFVYAKTALRRARGGTRLSRPLHQQYVRGVSGYGSNIDPRIVPLAAAVRR